ncbi:Uncharacterised protein [Streptococcus pneumoniae]|nr:Uncharacterised protein [Streptococcus pneumoniae]CRI00460.1 Uncharacterised protein [Streptococcus pneumoniae]
MIAITGTIISTARAIRFTPPKIITASRPAITRPTNLLSVLNAPSKAAATVLDCTALKINPKLTVINTEKIAPSQRLFKPFSI